MREILAACADLKLSYKILPVSFAYLNDRADLARSRTCRRTTCCPASEVRFDDEELDALVRGRRILVTGAAGSIGSEACRQIAAHAPALLVLADIDENNLYFLFRHLRHLHPEPARSRPQVVDIRDAARVEQLLREYRPQDVVHAAAHKHVPLMEYAPEEAVKNNVIGCLNLVDGVRPAGRRALRARLDRQGGQPRECHGSDEAAWPSWWCQQRAATSKTRFSTVRFGNVLGSAGSVVPLFKEQIARGGPVTVTHPDCRALPDDDPRGGGAGAAGRPGRATASC